MLCLWEGVCPVNGCSVSWSVSPCCIPSLLMLVVSLKVCDKEALAADSLALSCCTCREKIWDHAAGVVIIEEAGGVVTDGMGRKLDFGLGRCVRSTDSTLVHEGASADQSNDRHDFVVNDSSFVEFRSLKTVEFAV
jgi:hypothetical protein